ncbi:MAG: phage tail tape measure protein [Pseudobacteriovorax sp.]|nr:phage tail tape measure protein [Pseudobacteriovorax sp.]
MVSKDFNVRLGISGNDTLSPTLSKLKKALTSVSSEYQNNTKRLEEYKRKTKAITVFKEQKASIEALSMKLKGSQMRTRQLANEMRQAGGGTKKMQKEFMAAKEESARLSRRLDDAKKGLHAMSMQARAAGINTGKLALEERKLALATAKTTRELKNQEKAYQAIKRKKEEIAKGRASFEKALERGADATLAADGISGVGGNILGAVGGAVETRRSAGALASSINAKALSGISDPQKREEELRKIVGEAERLGATTSFSLSEVLQGQEALAEAGFKSNQIIAASAGLLDLAKSGNLDLAEATRISSGILGQFGMKAGELSGVADVMATIATSAQTNVREAGEAFTYAGSVAATAGVKINELAAFTKVLAERSIVGSSAGTALRSSIIRLAAPPSAAAKAIEGLGISLDGLSIQEKIKAIAEATKDYDREKRLSIASDIAGQEAVSGFIALMDASIRSTNEEAKSLADLSKSFAGVTGAASDMAAMMGDNLNGDLMALASIKEALSNTIGKSLEPALRAGTQALTSIFAGLNSVLSISPALTSVIVGATAAFGGLLTVVAGGVSVFMAANSTIAALQFGMVLLGKSTLFGVSALKVLKIALISSGIGAIVVGLGLAVAAIAENWDWVKQKAMDFVNFIKPALLTIFPEMRSMFDIFGEEEKAGAKGPVTGAKEAANPGAVTINAPINFNMQDDEVLSQILNKKMGEAKTEMDDYRKAMWDSQQ